MAAKTAKNGVIILAHNDTVAIGGKGMEIMGAIISDSTGNVNCTLYTGPTVEPANALFDLVTPSTYSPVQVHIHGSPSTGAGLLYAGTDTTCYLYVR